MAVGPVQVPMGLRSLGWASVITGIVLENNVIRRSRVPHPPPLPATVARDRPRAGPAGSWGATAEGQEGWSVQPPAMAVLLSRWHPGPAFLPALWTWDVPSHPTPGCLACLSLSGASATGTSHWWPVRGLR